MREFRVSTVDELDQVAQHILSLTKNRDILLLFGPMGVGKTELVRSLVRLCGDDAISSPSFAIHNHYSVGSRAIEHLDLFRIEGEDDLESTGFWDLFDQKNGLIILEWAERLDERMLPQNWNKIKVSLEFASGNIRKIVVS